MPGGPYIRIQVDESFLEKYFSELEARLDRHEEMILELQKMLKDKADREDIDKIHEQIEKEVTERQTQLDTRISNLEAKFDSQGKDMEALLEEKFAVMSRLFDNKLNEKLENLAAMMPNNGAKVDALTKRIQRCEEEVSATNNRLILTRDSVQNIADGIASITNGDAQLDNTLSETMNATASYITNNIQRIYDEIDAIKDREQISTIVDRSPGSRQSVTRSITSAGHAQPAIIVRDSGPGGTGAAAVVPDFNLADIRPYPSVTVHWRDPPELPIVHPFISMGDCVDYIYRLMPKLQAHLNAMHGKLLEMNAAMADKVDKALVEKMYEKFQTIVGEMKQRVDDLKDACEQTATRDEINGIVEELFAQMNVESQTSVGRVKCIACGRDMTQVAGAMTETEIARALGNPLNSIAYKASGGPQMAYSSRDGFDSAITETPRSVRPLRPMQVRPRIKNQK